MTRLKMAALGSACILAATGGAFAQELPGSFPGVTVDAKLIGGQQ